MTDRDRYLATMDYEPVDRPFVTEWGYWPETLERWIAEGAPAGLRWNGSDDNTTDAAFGLDSYRTYLPVDLGLFPAFEVKQIEDRGAEELVQQADGVRVVRSKRMGSIPHPERWILTDRETWEEHYRPRLDPRAAGRLGPGLAEKWSAWQAGGRPAPLAVGPTSLFGWIRNWMGFENATMLPYDDPDLLHEMVATIADCAIGTFDRLFAEGIVPDVVYFWEDICFNSGPMISPDTAREFLLPHYQRITSFCREHGVRWFALDSDGRLDHLIPVWLEGGINILYPVEIGTCGNDVAAFRQRFGRGMRYMGGFDKRLLAQGPAAIDAELRRLAPLIREGGFIPFCDHHVPPDVPLANFQHYLNAKRTLTPYRRP
jgi:uroporphyrinogen decarboxylase